MHNKSLLSRVYEYNGSFVTFDKTNDATMVNATQMAKPFKKLVADWTRQKSTEEFLSALSTVRGIPISALIQTIKGGNSAQGTWMHEDVALEFARWLSPQFAIWCNDRIKELFKEGVVKAQRTEERRKLLAVERDTPHPAKGNRHRADYERAAGRLVFIKYGVPVTTSLTIARMRGTGHNNTLKTIRKMVELNPALSGDVTESYYIARAMGIHGRGKQRQPMLLLTRRALALYIMRTKRMKPGTLQPIIDAFDRAEADIAKNKASEGQADLFTHTDAQPLPPTSTLTPPTPTPPVTAAATPTQGDMAERMIAAMAVLTGADIKKVQDIMRKGGAL